MTNDKPNNDNHIKHIRQTTHVSDQGIRFAEFELAGDEQDVSLPDKHSDMLHQEQEPMNPVAPTKKSLIVKPQQPLDMNWGEDFRYVTKEQQFVQKARELAWHVEGEAPLWLSKAIGRPTTRWPATSSSGIFTGGRKSGPGGTRIRTYPICLSILRADPWRGLERSPAGL